MKRHQHWNLYQGAKIISSKKLFQLRTAGHSGEFKANSAMQRRRGRDGKSQWGWRTPKKKKKAFQTQQEGCAYELTETVAVCTASAQVHVRWDPSAERGGGHKSPSITQKLHQVSTASRGKLVFSISLTKGRPCAQQ